MRKNLGRYIDHNLLQPVGFLFLGFVLLELTHGQPVVFGFLTLVGGALMPSLWHMSTTLTPASVSLWFISIRYSE